MKCFDRGGTVVHRRRVLGIRSIEAFLGAVYPPPAHPVLLQVYPQCYTSQCGDIWSMRPFVREGTASRTLVAIHDVSRMVDPRAQVTKGLRPLWFCRLITRDLIHMQVQRTRCCP